MFVTLALQPGLAAFAPSLLYLWQAQNPSEENGATSWFWLVILLLLTLLVWWLLSRESISLPAAAGIKSSTADHAYTSHESPAVAAVSATAPATSLGADTPPPATSSGLQDNLTKIEGIGPKINGILHDAGIHTFADLGKTEVSRLREILVQAGLKVNDPTTWPEQAALAAEGKWEELQSLQDQLDGGRRRA